MGCSKGVFSLEKNLQGILMSWRRFLDFFDICKNPGYIVAFGKDIKLDT